MRSAIVITVATLIGHLIPLGARSRDFLRTTFT